MARSIRPNNPTISAGRLRGRRLEVPPGRSVRPTRSLVRQALFDMLGPRIVGARVLDLYSGSGAMGLEALSRGAERVVLVERSATTLAVLRRNLAACGVGPDEAPIHAADARIVDPMPHAPFDLVLADPPFALRDALPAAVATGAAVTAEGLLVMHTPSDRPAPDPGPAWGPPRSRRHGRSCVHIFERADTSPSC